jgi:predicted HicB family RNase H-like nuclease
MKNTMTYKDYTALIEYNENEYGFSGKILYIRRSISFEGETLKELRTAFESEVDGYIRYCEKKGIKPDKPYKGSFNVRISPELHRKAATKAAQEGKSLNKIVENAIRRFV